MNIQKFLMLFASVSFSFACVHAASPALSISTDSDSDGEVVAPESHSSSPRLRMRASSSTADEVAGDIGAPTELAESKSPVVEQVASSTARRASGSGDALEIHPVATSYENAASYDAKGEPEAVRPTSPTARRASGDAEELHGLPVDSSVQEPANHGLPASGSSTNLSSEEMIKAAPETKNLWDRLSAQGRKVWLDALEGKYWSAESQEQFVVVALSAAVVVVAIAVAYTDECTQIGFALTNADFVACLNHIPSTVWNAATHSFDFVSGHCGDLISHLRSLIA